MEVLYNFHTSSCGRAATVRAAVESLQCECYRGQAAGENQVECFCPGDFIIHKIVRETKTQNVHIEVALVFVPIAAKHCDNCAALTFGLHIFYVGGEWM